MNFIKLIILVISLRLINCNIESDLADDIVAYITKNLSISMVKFLSNQMAILRRPEVKNLFYRIIKSVPILNLNINKFIESNSSPLTSPQSISTLIIYIHFPAAKGILPSTKVIDVMKKVSLGKTVVNYLVIHYSSERNDYLEETLKYAWNKLQMLDFTIIEIINREMTNTRMIDENESTILLRQYNPFTKNISVLSYSKTSELFPCFINDMHGYPLKIGMRHLIPFSRVQKLANGQMKFDGVNKIFMETLSAMMNFTAVFVRQQYQHNYHIDELLLPMLNNKVDIDARLYAHLTENALINAMLTAPIDDDEYCAVVPYINKKPSLIISMETIGVYVIAILILALFWLLERFAHLDSHYWSPFIVIRILFAVAVQRHPEHSADRIMFMSLALVAIVYSTKLYTSMTHGVVSKVKTTEWETLEELNASDLTLIIHPLYFNKTFDYADGVILDLKTKTKKKLNEMLCLRLLIEQKNISCLMSRNEYKAMEAYLPQQMLKLVQPCFWRDSTAFFLAEKSPYHERIRKIITIFHESGFKKKWYHIGFERLAIARNQFHSSKSIAPSNNIRKPCLIILSIGYSLATIAFIGELIYHYKFRKT